MNVGFYMDEHVQDAITLGLRRRSVDVLTVQEDEMRGRPDTDILDRAGALGRVVFTRDDDFLAEAARRQEQGKPFAGVVYVHQERLSIGNCINDLEVIAKATEPVDYANRVEYLPL